MEPVKEIDIGSAELFVFEWVRLSGKLFFHGSGRVKKEDGDAYGDYFFSFLMDERGHAPPTGWGARSVPPGVSVPGFKINVESRTKLRNWLFPKPRLQPGLV